MSIALVVPLRSSPALDPGEQTRSWWEALAGLRYAATSAPIRRLLNLMAASAFFLLGPYTLLMPDYAKRILGLDEAGRGIFLGSAGLSFLVGGVLARTLARSAQRRAILSASLSLAGLGLGQLALVSRVEMAVPALTMLGLGGSVAWGVGVAALQSSTEARYSGRVMAVYVAVQPIFTALGAWAFGWLAQLSSTPAALGTAGLLLAVGTASYGIAVRADSVPRR
jgi:predicted MFS family arabinose efflux permease